MFTITPAIAVTIMLTALPLTTLGLSISLIHLHRRHRSMRQTLNRVVLERDSAIWDLHQAGLKPSKAPARG